MNQALFESWLRLQCRAISGVRMAIARLDERGPGQQALIAIVPTKSSLFSELDDMLRLAQRGGRTVVAGSMNAVRDTRSGLRIAHPLVHSSQAVGGIAIELEQGNLEQQKTITKLLKWGNAWLELLLNQTRQGDPSDDTSQQEVLRLVLGAEHFQEAALAAIGVFAHRYDAERVSLGIRSGNRVRPIALSDSSGFSPRSALARQLEQVMSKTLEQGGPVNWPDDATIPATDHGPLAEQQADGAIFSMVLHGINKDFGVITLEKRLHEQFGKDEQTAIIRTAQLLGPILELKQTQEQSLMSRVRNQITRGYTDFVAGHRFGALFGVAAGVALLIFLLIGTSSYRVGGPAELQGAVQRALIAPFDGYIATAHARAGERVDADFILARLDDQELRLELRQLDGDLKELHKQYRKALAALDHSELRIIQAQIAQAEARIDLLQQHLARTQLVAPFAAVVVSGDLSRSLGKPVERGEVLFELAPLDAYRVVVEVPDRDIAAVTHGQHGTLVLAASPTEQLPIEVVNVTSATGSSVKPGSFRVEARLIDSPVTLRPGMRGVAKVEVGERRRIWIWTHELIDWLHFQLWAWLP